MIGWSNIPTHISTSLSQTPERVVTVTYEHPLMNACAAIADDDDSRRLVSNLE